MSEMLKVGRINKFTETHSEMLSYATILMNIVNLADG